MNDDLMMTNSNEEAGSAPVDERKATAQPDNPAVKANIGGRALVSAAAVAVALTLPLIPIRSVEAIGLSGDSGGGVSIDLGDAGDCMDCDSDRDKDRDKDRDNDIDSIRDSGAGFHDYYSWN